MIIDEERLQDYIDDRMSDRERAEFAAILLSDRESARYADELRRHNETLKLVGIEVLDEPIPEHLLSILEGGASQPPAAGSPSTKGGHANEREVKAVPFWRSNWARAATVAFVFVAGGVSGWWSHSQLNTAPTADQMALSSGRDAYLLYAIESSFPVEFGGDRSSELEEWIERAFSKRFAPPALDDLGYKYVGGRLLPWSDGNFGFYLFEKENQSRVAMVWWPRKDPPAAVSNALKYKGVNARFWGKKGFGFALYADEENTDLDGITEMVYSFYDTLFGDDQETE